MIRYEKSGDVATITLDRPERKNALTVEMRVELERVANEASSDTEVRAVMLTGAGGAFCAGVDASGMGGRDAQASRVRLRALQKCVQAIYAVDKPVIASVDGPCVGLGWSLALACDHVIASEQAVFSQVFGRMGLAPDGGSAWFLTRNLGILRAKELIFSCRKLGAAEAREYGLVNEVCAPDALASRAAELAATLAAGPTMALALSKKMVHAASAGALETFLETELSMQTQLTQSLDYREGVTAFKEKRSPKFEGR